MIKVFTLIIALCGELAPGRREWRARKMTDDPGFAAAFDQLKADLRPVTITAINPTIEDYRRAGAMAGEKSADRFLAYCFQNKHSIADVALWNTKRDAFLIKAAAEIENSCEIMCEK